MTRKKWPKGASTTSASAASPYTRKLTPKTDPDYIAKIEDKLGQLVPDELTPYRNLFEAARYTLLSGGKRLRPRLTLYITEMFGSSYEAALAPACAVEMIHTYSMIHDDLPCMDDDDMRRGKPTLHKVYNDGHAVLTGDFLLTRAFQAIAEEPRLSFQQRCEMTHVLSQAAGGHGLIGGQVVDILENPKELEDLRKLYANKTGALFVAAVELGAIAAEASDDERKLMRKFGEKLGLAYQILNDILDVSSSMELRGTEISSDLKNGKTTYVSLLGLEGATAEFKTLKKECHEILKKLKRPTDKLEAYLECDGLTSLFEEPA